MTDPRDWEQLATQAEEEAARFPLKPEYEGRVDAAIEAARQRLGGDNVEGHPVSFNPDKWKHVPDALPVHCMESGRITRGDLFAVTGDVNADRSMWRLFVASKVWGYGRGGYGPARLTKVRRRTPESRMGILLGKALGTGAEHGVMAAYDQLRGQHRYRGVAKHWGSAFFTKALYAGLWNQDHARPALILDEVLAKKVTILSDLPHLLYQGKGYNSSFYRYGVYLAWMGQTAVRFDVALEFLEYSLFKANLSN